MDAEQSGPAPATPNAPEAPRSVRTRTGRAWTIKTLVFMVALALLAVWGWYDAMYEYPHRGQVHELFMRRDYLVETDKAFQMATASVEDPAVEYARLTSAEPDTLTPVEKARLSWLRSVSRLASLSRLTRENQDEIQKRKDPSYTRKDTHTMFADARRTRDELNAHLSQSSQPKPLAAYDLPMQYVFLLGGAAGAVYLFGLFLSVRSRVYRYEPVAHRLTLPSGRSLVPGDIALVDKRQWDKFIVFLKPVDGSHEIRLDLYRHHPLEEWVLEMEKLTPGYQPPDEGEQPGEAS